MKGTVRAVYTHEFKQEAIQLVAGGERVSSVARRSGVSSRSIDNWVQAAAAGQLSDVKGKSIRAFFSEVGSPSGSKNAVK